MEKGSQLYNELKTCAMKELYKYYTPGCISLAGGLPLESCFPILEVNIKLPSSVGGDSLKSTDEEQTLNDISGDGDKKSSFSIKRGLDTGLFLNYTRGYGMAPLQEWISSHVNALHPRKKTDSEEVESCNEVVSISTCMTVGATDAFTKVLMLMDTEVVLFDDYAYAGALTPCRSWGKIPVGVESDEHGMIPSALRDAILNCRGQGRTVNLVYLVPTGGNPTGITIPLQRKMELLNICRELDIFLVEDDAYYYISYHDLPMEEDQTLSPCIAEKKAGDEIVEPSKHSMPGLKNLPRSFLSLDVDGRVIRIDTLSKTIAPGMRLGWISACTPFIEKFNILQECTNQAPSGLSQSIFLGLVNHWGEDGFDDHIRQMQLHYCKQRNVLIKEIQANFSPSECVFVVPTCGMFIWLTFSLQNTSSFELFKAFAAVGVITVAASEFIVPAYGAAVVDDKPSVRLTYAAATPEQLKTAVEKMAVCYRSIVAEKGTTTTHTSTVN